MDNTAELKVLEAELNNLYKVIYAAAAIGIVGSWIYVINIKKGSSSTSTYAGFLGGILSASAARLILNKKIKQKQLEITKLK